MHIITRALALLAISFILSPPIAAYAADQTNISLATATPGGGFMLFGDNAAEVINETDATLSVTTANTKGSQENIERLAAGEFDIGLVSGVPAYEAIAGIGRAPVDLKIIAATYSSPGMFAVAPDSPAETLDDLRSKPIAWGTRSSGLTLMAQFIMDGLGLNRDVDFKSRFLEKAADGPGLVLDGEVAALWGGGIGWPGFTKMAQAGGRFIGFSDEQVARITAKHSFLKPMSVPAGSYEGQAQPITTVGVWSYILARPDLSDDVAYRLARALHRGQDALARRLDQARETKPENTLAAAFGRDSIHPGVLRYLRELGL